MTQTKLNPLQTNDNILSSSIFRQALINGNFDVWQRGTSLSLADVTVHFLADRWYSYINKDGGTPPTVTISKQTLGLGDIYGSYYHYRIATNGAGTSFGNLSRCYTDQKIENGTRYLCGDGKKVTLSFWARSDVANKKLGVTVFQGYGSGGSPTSAELLTVTDPVITLTSTWTKYTRTITTNTLAGKTFGTANDDFLQIKLNHIWGSTTATSYGLTGTSDFGGSGYTDIAQVQLCAGDVALPFMPKSFEEELRACQRYFEFLDGNTGRVTSATDGLICAHFRVPKHRNVATADIVFIGSSDNCSEVGISARKFTSGSVNRTGNYSAELTFTGASGMTEPRLLLIYNNQIAVNTEL